MTTAHSWKNYLLFLIFVFIFILFYKKYQKTWVQLLPNIIKFEKINTQSGLYDSLLYLSSRNEWIYQNKEQEEQNNKRILWNERFGPYLIGLGSVLGINLPNFLGTKTVEVVLGVGFFGISLVFCYILSMIVVRFLWVCKWEKENKKIISFREYREE
ncbi:hypothetical protein ACFL1F_00520 [Chlamydiota bacterium]